MFFLVLKPITPQGDGNLLNNGASFHTIKFVLKPITPQGDGNIWLLKLFNATGLVLKPITPQGEYMNRLIA